MEGKNGRAPLHDESAERVANFAFSFCASSAFCFWKSAGAAWEIAARARRTRAESLVENIVNLGESGWVGTCTDGERKNNDARWTSTGTGTVKE